jgi:filamentous hemagglutinin family protein
MKHLKQSLTRRYHGHAIVFFLIYVMFLNISPPMAWAGPEGAQVIHGEVSIQQNASNTTITASDKAIINYSSFDIGRPETVQFIQPSSSASVLNRILSASPTNINGTLSANGRIFFVNPAGIYIGAGARINVAQLVASGLNISNSDFIGGRYHFADGNGSVINGGDISAEQVYLIGQQVTNSGNINCPAGYVVMAAGDRVFLGEPGSEIILEMDAPSLSESADAAGSGTGVLNEGTINATGGIIALAAAGDIYSQAISNVGAISASVETGDAGKVKLTAAEGTVMNSGTIEAKSNSGAGGTVQMLGDRVGLFDAGQIDVSGSDGGGTVLIGGDYQGKGDVLTASRTHVGPDASIHADATENGDGGKVIVWADEMTRFYGDISARGGSEGGDGGFVEVSGRQNLGFYGTVDTTAPAGKVGQLLLDPDQLNIVGGAGPGTLDGSLPSIAFADGGVTESVSETALEAVVADVTLEATSGITATTGGGWTGGLTMPSNIDLILRTRNDQNAGEGVTGIDLTVAGSISLQGTGSLDITTGYDDGTAGYIQGAAPVTLPAVTTSTGGVTVNSSGQVDLGNVSTGGALTVAGTNIDLTGTTYTSTGDDVTFTGAVDLDAGAATTVVTAGGAAGDAVTFTGTVNDAASNTTLRLVGGAGAVDMQNNVGTTSAVEAFTVTSAGQVDLADVTADGAISVTGTNIDLTGTTYTSTGDDVTFTGAVDLDAGATTTVVTAGGVAGDAVTFTGTVDDAASNTTLRLVGGAGEVDMQDNVGTDNAVAAFTVTSAGQVNLADVTTAGNLELNGTTTVADGSTLTAGNNLNIGAASLTGDGALTLIATGGSISGSGTIQATDGVGTDLTLRQGDSLDLANLTFSNQSNTDLMAQSYTGGVTIDETNPANAPDQWQSIAATAVNNIEVSSDGDIRIASAGLTSSAGGVKVISDDGTISTPGAGGALNAPITGSSDTSGAGVDLPNGTGKAAIVIRSPSHDLSLGAGATLTANGSYSLAVDDRTGVWFDASGSDTSDPIDIAIYLGSYQPDPLPATGHNIAVNSGISMANHGTMVIDGFETVTFEGAFETSTFGPTDRLEVVSRISTSWNEVITVPPRLPHARNPAAIRSAFAAAGGSFAGAYVLRGKVLFAQMLALIEAVPWAVPRPLELEMGGEVEGPDTEDLEQLLNELGIGIQPYVTEAFPASMSTDLRLFSAAEKLQQLIPILEDANGTGIAALRATVAQFFPSLDALSEEQVSSFAQELVRHKGDGTDYDTAGRCIFALTEYVAILGNDIGWPVEKSVGFVMGRYVPRLTEGDEIRIAVIQMQLQKAPGV